MSNKNTIIKCENLVKTYNDGKLTVEVIKNLNMNIPSASSICILGSSGSGKSTLLHLLGGLDNYTSGNVYWADTNINKLNATKIGFLRNQYLGFVYQFHHLLMDFTALENVAIPLYVKNKNKKEALQKAEKLITKIGLNKRLNHRPKELSGGERQRIAIARALITNPKCILADEPTGNLDRNNAKIIFDLLLDLKHEFNTAILVVTHDYELKSYFDTTYQMKDGKLNEIKL